MNDKLNKTSICSVLALEIIDFAKKTESEQAEIKAMLNAFVQHALIDIPDDDRVIVDTGSGAAIACSGPLEDALEDALFIAITIRDEILKSNALGYSPLYVQFGINFGAARTVTNKSLLSITGEGVEEAKRIMSFANPNQILVSHIYFEMASKLTQEMAQMFERYEMHAHEHDIYAVRVLKETPADESVLVVGSTDASVTNVSKINWKYAGLGLLAMVMIYALVKIVSTPVKPVMDEAILHEPVTTQETMQPATTTNQNSKPATKTRPNQDQVKKVKSTQEASRKEGSVAASVSDSKTSKADNDAAKQSEPTTGSTKDKSGWQTFKESVTNGSDSKCTQAEIALNQCAN
jgi:hypothetical protein